MDQSYRESDVSFANAIAEGSILVSRLKLINLA
jgi:hypothetical protein